MHDIAEKVNHEEKKTNWVYSPLCILSRATDNAYFDSIAMTRKLADNWGGKVDERLVERLELSQKVKTDELVAECHRSWDDLNYMICGLGCPSSRYPLPRQGMFPQKVFEEVNMKNLVGDILHSFYDLDGRLYESKGDDLIIPLEKIKSIPYTIAVASGFPKVESIIGALRTGLIDTLITDVQTAQHVIDYLK
jgi:Transcriptional regulator, contains sigma factor-related N-terminal domain